MYQHTGTTSQRKQKAVIGAGHAEPNLLPSRLLDKIGQPGGGERVHTSSRKQPMEIISHNARSKNKQALRANSIRSAATRKAPGALTSPPP
jgi:hypothetical protein